MKLEVKHSESKSAWNIVNTKLGGKYKVARIPYLPQQKEEAKRHADLLADAPDMLGLLRKAVDNFIAIDATDHGIKDEMIKILDRHDRI